MTRPIFVRLADAAAVMSGRQVDLAKHVGKPAAEFGADAPGAIELRPDPAFAELLGQ